MCVCECETDRTRVRDIETQREIVREKCRKYIDIERAQERERERERKGTARGRSTTCHSCQTLPVTGGTPALGWLLSGSFHLVEVIGDEGFSSSHFSPVTTHRQSHRLQRLRDRAELTTPRRCLMPPESTEDTGLWTTVGIRK